MAKCNSMPLVRLGLTICVVKCSYFLVRHRVYKITLLFCLGGSRQSFFLFKGSRSLLSLALTLRNLLYVLFLSCKAVLSAMLAVLCYVCGYGIVCPSICICRSIFIYYKRALHVYGCMRTLCV